MDYISFLNKELEKVNFFNNTMNPIDCKKAWAAFKSFSKQLLTHVTHESNCTDFALLWETGVYNFTGEWFFNYSMTAQFSYEINGEYSHMEQLHFIIYFEPNDLLYDLEDCIWSYDFENFDEFFECIESTESFEIPPLKFKPISYNIYFGRV